MQIAHHLKRPSFSSARFGNQPAATKINIAAQADVFCKDLRALQEESHGIIRIGDEKVLHQKVETYLTEKANHLERALMIGAMAPSGAGKTTIMNSLAQAFARLLNGPISSTANVDKAAPSLLPGQAQKPVVTNMNMDNYFKDNAARRAALGDAKFFQTVDLDSPAAYQMQQLSLDIDQLKAGRNIRSPQYDMTNSRSTPDHTPVTASPVTLVEGLMLFAKESGATPPAASPDLEPKFDLTMSVDLDNTQRKARWQQHQIEARGGIGDGSQKAHDDMWQKIELKKAEYIDPRKPQMTIHIDNAESREKVREIMDRLAEITTNDLIMPFTGNRILQTAA